MSFVPKAELNIGDEVVVREAPCGLNSFDYLFVNQKGKVVAENRAGYVVSMRLKDERLSLRYTFKRKSLVKV